MNRSLRNLFFADFVAVVIAVITIVLLQQVFIRLINTSPNKIITIACDMIKFYCKLNKTDMLFDIIDLEEQSKVNI